MRQDIHIKKLHNLNHINFIVIYLNSIDISYSSLVAFVYRGNCLYNISIHQFLKLVNIYLESFHLQDRLILYLTQKSFVLLLAFLCLLLCHQQHKVNKLFQLSMYFTKHLKSKRLLFLQHFNQNFCFLTLRQNYWWKAVILILWLKQMLKLFRFKQSILMSHYFSINKALFYWIKSKMSWISFSKSITSWATQYRFASNQAVAVNQITSHA